MPRSLPKPEPYGLSTTPPLSSILSRRERNTFPARLHPNQSIPDSLSTSIALPVLVPDSTPLGQSLRPSPSPCTSCRATEWRALRSWWMASAFPLAQPASSSNGLGSMLKRPHSFMTPMRCCHSREHGLCSSWCAPPRLLILPPATGSITPSTPQQPLPAIPSQAPAAL